MLGKQAHFARLSLIAAAALLGLGAACGGASVSGEPAAPTQASEGTMEGQPTGTQSSGRRMEPRDRPYGPRLETPAEARNSYAPFISMLVPGYTVRFAAEGEPEDTWDPGRAVEQGLVWSVPFVVRGTDWRHGGVFSFAQYIQTRRQEGRAAYRLRLLSIGEADPLVHLWMGAGGFFDVDEGFGPRAELAWVFGELGRGSAMLLFGWQLETDDREHAFEVALSAFVPYVFR